MTMYLCTVATIFVWLCRVLRRPLSGTTGGHELKRFVKPLAIRLADDDEAMPPSPAAVGYWKRIDLGSGE